jgi:uncharacterized protein YvpB
MNELIVLKEYDDEYILVEDPYGETAVMTKQEYKTYLENVQKLKSKKE